MGHTRELSKVTKKKAVGIKNTIYFRWNLINFIGLNLKSRYLLAIPSIAASPKLLRLTAYGGIPWFKKNKAFTEKTNIPPIGLGTDKILTQSNGSTSLDQINAETRSWTSSVMTSMDRILCLKFSLNSLNFVSWENLIQK